MTDQEFKNIEILIRNGIPARKATATAAQRAQFMRMKKKKGPPPEAAPPPSEAVASVIREATIAANIEPTVPTPAQIVPQTVDLKATVPVDTRELLEIAKRAIYEQIAHTRDLAPAWVKLVFELCEKELPEWSNRGAKVAKDEYQSILESVLKENKGFRILERNTDDTDVKHGDTSKTRSPG